MTQNLVRTRLFFNQHKNLIGFYSLFNDTIKINKHKREQFDIKLPHTVKEIPAIRFHYLGIDNRYRGKGYGNDLMASVIVSCINVARLSGCTLITLESTKNVIDFYRKYEFVYVRPNGDYYLMALNTKPFIDV